MGIAMSRDGRRAYVTTGRAGAVAVIDAAAGTRVASIPDVGKRPWGIAIAPSGLVFTANGPSNDVSVIDPTPTPAVTLVGCYPFYHVGSAPQRFIVRAVPATGSPAGS
jgi:YVTN family beta-propeller protein